MSSPRYLPGCLSLLAGWLLVAGFFSLFRIESVNQVMGVVGSTLFFGTLIGALILGMLPRRN